ncbi:uncharacterized protein LOC106884440 [Octopus bimaculoides]|uniref:uncharacterized protein LOC106884440 n=1 Tax=Octopus bimaculoides TaxID=37653 RepID=UPI00071D17B0|nr:uncharacterized protein LOC106884440 [Octopus bimaculoides]|eukprot:XP_014791314.1 PREDICTED: uncharacterized protein LOC106884440 [Octopus bimaculoides]
MAHKGSLETLDMILKDIRSCISPMGGISLLLSGDFRQTLPIIPKGTRANAVMACIELSSLWQDVPILTLTTNMRAQLFGDNLSGDFSKQLLTIGDGTAGEMTVSHVGIPVDTVDLTTAVFPDLHINYQNLNWLCERAILDPKNTFVAKLNENLLRSLPGNLHTYKSVDTVVDQEEVYPDTSFSSFVTVKAMFFLYCKTPISISVS